jgi:hypothetical protein
MSWYALYTVEAKQSLNTPAVDHRRQEFRQRDGRARRCRSPDLAHGLHRRSYPHLPLLVTMVQELLDHHLPESYCDCGSR